jgi:hypothetical protein
MADNPIPAGVAMARAACAGLSQAQRIAFAIELVRDITDPDCAFHLKRLEQLAAMVAHELVRARFEQECG